MTWRCTIRPTRFQFELRGDRFWAPPVQVELLQCCCLEDGLRSLLQEGTALDAVIAARFEAADGWHSFDLQQIHEVRAIALEETGCR